MTSLTIGLSIIVLGFIFYFAFQKISQQNQSQLQGGFRLLSESFESLQRNLLLSQKEFEKSHEQKNLQLRTELQDNLHHTRKELQTGIGDLTKNVGARLEQNLKEGFLHFEKIQGHLKQAELQLLNLNTVGQSIHDLNNLLKLPHLRGGFGEAMLEALLSDLLPVGAYELQYRVVPNSTERVDAVVRYPNSVLPIDSKFPREQVLPLFETGDPEKLEVARKNLTEVIRSLAKQIKEKYVHPEHGTTEMALLFVPSETLYFEILRSVKLCEELGRLKVFAVSPNTLAVTLHSISLSRNYYEMAKGVEKTIIEVKKAQQHFKNFEGRFDEVGSSLNKATHAFNTATTHLSRYGSAIGRLTGIDNTEIPSALPSAEATLEQPEKTL